MTCNSCHTRETPEPWALILEHASERQRAGALRVTMTPGLRLCATEKLSMRSISSTRRPTVVRTIHEKHLNLTKVE